MRIAMQYESKGHHEKRARVTRLMEEFAEAIKWQALRIQGPVFPQYRDMPNWQFQAAFESYLAHCGIMALTPQAKKKRTPHSTRHTWTCLMLASGENEILVQHYAGHTQKEMTGYYARQQDIFRRQVEKAGWPKGELRLREFTKNVEVAANVS
jgi:integrase